MWDFDKKYRTEEWYDDVKNRPLTSPLCIPSYNRPDAPVFRSKICKTMDKGNIFIFIRDTKEQYDLYREHKDKVTLVPLPHHVKELGLTRESILQWGIENKFQNLFMVDDRAQNLSTFVPALTRNKKLCMKPASWSTPEVTMKIWEHLQTLYNTTISFAVFQQTSWYSSNINCNPRLNGYTEALCINLVDVEKFDLHYQNIWEYGIEEIRFLFSILSKGLPALQFNDIAYKEIPPEKMNQISGSGASVSSQFAKPLSRDERIQLNCKTFVEATLGKTWGEPLDGFKYVKVNENFCRLDFIWKYWAKYYEEHKVR